MVVPASRPSSARRVAATPAMVAALWSEVLGTAPVRPDDAVVSLGAESLHMNRMVARVRRAFGVNVPFRTVFGAATPAELAEVIRAFHDGPGQDAPVTGPVHLEGPRARLSQDQRRLWLLDQSGEGTTAYNLPVVMRLRGPLDVSALRASVRDIIGRHDVLRTRVVVADHQAVQQVDEPAAVDLPVVDVAGGLADAMALVDELTARRFDLTAAPPWRVTAYRLGSEDHVVAFVLHHLVFDGWSEAILRTELSRCYAARCAGVEPAFAPMPLQYAQWAEWQAEREQAADLAPQLRYWREKLADLSVVDLPADRLRPARSSDRGAGHVFTVDAATVAAARALAQEHGATPFMVLLSAWVALLGRYCGQPDVSTGTSMAGRPHADLEALVGSFVNIFVIRADLGGRPSFLDLLRQVRETTLEAFANQDVPFDRLVAELAPARSAARNPLFNVMFAYLNMPAAREEWRDLSVEQLRPSTTAATFDVTLSLRDQPDGGIGGHLEYSTDLFDAETMARLATSFTRLLAGAVADPGRPVDRVPLLSDADRHRLLVGPAHTTPLPRTTVPAVVAEQTAGAPDAVAVVSGGERLTYAELSRRATKLAGRLRDLGVGPERGVAIRLPRGVDQVVALLGVMAAGGYAVPLDDEHPAERVADLIGLARPYALVTAGEDRARAGLDAGAARIVRLDEDPGDPVSPGTCPGLTADDLAATIFTSGSSGRPKAVAITHANLLFAHGARVVLGLPPERVLLPVSIAFDVFVSFVVSTLASGGGLVIPVRERGADTDELAALLREQRVTHLVAPPNLQRALFARDDVRAGNHLVAGIVGGEACPRVLAEDYRDWTPGAHLLNEYGLTETSSAGTVFVVDASALDAAGEQLPIGRPMANVRAYVLDDVMEPVPEGVAAELYLGGPGTTRGYLGDPARTADRFVPDPFGPPGARLYRTGDVARWDRDGNLQFLGRRDGQVKVRGLRIELAEVEAALVRHPAVAEAAVCLPADGDRLVAFVTAADGAEPDADQLRAHLLATLPEPMVPSAIATLARLPLTATGKVDRAALAQTPVEEPVQRVHTGPRSPAEHTVAAVWGEILGLSEVDVLADFFALGGHSLLAADVVSRLRDEFPVQIGLRDLFDAPTVADLAARIGERALAAMRDQFGVPAAEAGEPSTSDAAEVAPAAPVIPVADRTRPLPLSAGQEQLWLQHEMNPGSAAYQVPIALRLRGPVHLDALRVALNAVVARHEVLRTRIDLRDDEPVQLVDPPGPVPLPVLPAGSAEEADATLRAQLAHPFDLRADHPLRVLLCRVADDDHTLLVVAHHVACDGASVRLLLDELAQEYAAAVSGGRSRVAGPSVQYADYAAWYRERTATPEYGERRAYWRDRLTGVRPLPLPLAPAVPDPVADAGGCVSFEFGRELSAAVHSCATRRSATPFVVLLAAFDGLLNRLGCGTDLAVGSPVSGRGRAELERLPGYFGNTLVLRADLSGTPDFDELVDRLKAVTAGALAAQDVALADVVRDLGVPRAGARNPLFNVLFAHEYAAADLPSFTGLSAETVPLPVRAVQFDLTLRITEHPDGALTGELDHLDATVDPAYAARIAGWYVRLLGLALAAPDHPVADLPLLDDRDLAELDRWNDTAVAAEPRCLHDLVLDQARRTPDATAVIDGGTQLSYQDLRDRALALARGLRAEGVLRGGVVAVCLPRSTDLPVALLATLMTGAMFLPLDPAHPEDRLAGVMRRHGATALVSTADVLASWRTPPAVPVLDPARSSQAASADPLPEAHPDDAAYLITTSGSTGEPKGVVVPHRGIVNRITWSLRRHGVGPGDRVLQKTTVSFDAAVWELFAPLVSGGVVVMARPGAERDPAALVADVVAHRVTILQAVPTMWRLLAAEPDLAACTSLRLVLSAGEVLTGDLCAALTRRVGAVVENTYGPTECSIDVTAWTHDPARDGPSGPVPIGRPIDNLRVHVMDDRLRRVPVGVVGELCVAGEGLATGYHGRPDLTAARFVPDPVDPGPGGRLYRTGDAARWLPDGTVEFLGRTDRQVKVRGVRTEPAEIESALRDHPDLRTAAVVPWAGADGDTRLVAYVVPVHGDEPPADLDDFLTARLPSAMIPSRVLALSRLPLTTSGKLDRSALPEPTPAPVADHAHVAPRTATEELVTSVWAEVLGVEGLGVTADFFEHGGHSLTAARITARLRAALDRPVSLADVLTARTPESLARLLDALDAGGGPRSVVRGDRVELSFAQQRLWFLEQLAPGGVAYLVPWVLRLRGRVDVGALLGALGALVARHEVLRTRYVVRDGTPRQVVDDGAPLEWDVAEVGAGDMDRVAGEWCRRPVDLVSGPVVRARLVSGGSDEHVLVVVLHHVACDGWSVGVLARELRVLYGVLASGGDPGDAGLVPVAVQYADFAAWQREWLSGARLEREVGYWRERLSGVTPLELPTDRPRPAVPDDTGDTVEFAVPAELAARLVALGHEHGATPFMVLHAVYTALLFRYTGESDVSVGVPVSGRHWPDVEDTVGLFVNTLVLRTRVDPAGTFAELLDRVRATTLDALAHQELPFERLVDELQVDRDLSRNPLFQLMFELNEADDESADWDGLEVRPVAVSRDTAKFDLTFALTWQRDGTLAGEVEYATALFDRDSVLRFAAHFTRLAAAIAAAPDRPVALHPLLTEREREQVLGPWAGTESPDTGRECLPDLLADRFRWDPGAGAVTDGTRVLTARELDEQANRLAHHLRNLGVEPEQRVAVLLRRSVDVPGVLLGVLRAGGVYVPIDPASPPERLRLLLDDVAPAVVVTSREHVGVAPSRTLVVIDADHDTIAARPASPPPGTRAPGDLAYVIYTSGSTGRPKGVMIQHGSYAHHCRVIADAYDIRAGDRVALLSALTFDVAMDQIGATLLAGATVVVGGDDLWSPAELPDRLGELGITHLEITPAHYRELMRVVSDRDPRLRALRLMNVGSDVVTTDDVRRWHTSGLPGRFLCNYGPTEATVTCLLHDHHDDHDDHDVLDDADGARAGATMPIGRPVPGTRCYVVDELMNPVPAGVPGELLLGGVRLARGYLGRPGLTAERFVPDPFGGTPGARLYRTGDLVRYRADGVIEFLGRIDTQVKIRGFRIELGEIEMALGERPEVAAVAVTVYEPRPGDRVLAAYVVPAGQDDLDVGALRTALAVRLPEYMVPSYWTRLDALPLTSSNKVDRRALPAPAERATAASPPESDAELAVAQVWEEVLGRSDFGVTDSFFDLGGHSLLVTRVRTLVEERFGIDLPLRTLFRAVTVAAQALALEEALVRDFEQLSEDEVAALMSDLEAR